jgi:hypothetical protein
MSAAGPTEPTIPGLTGARRVSLERFPVRTREGATTVSGWRLTVASDEGEGTITRVELSSGAMIHRGEGVFLGWSEERLTAGYAALMPLDEPEPPPPLQLG